MRDGRYAEWWNYPDAPEFPWQGTFPQATIGQRPEAL
jgi:hypothetical protein